MTDPNRVFLHGQQQSYGALLRFMQPYGGTVLLDGHFPVDLFLQHARLFPPAHRHLPGRPQACHHNAVHFAQGNPQRSVITGLALHRGIWVSHSWLEENGETIETTPIIREQYLGFVTAAHDLFTVLKGESHVRSGLAPKVGRFRVETRLRSRVQHWLSLPAQGTV